MSTLGLLNAVLLVLPMLIAAYLGFYTWQRRTIPGAVSFTLIMVVVGGWSATAALVVVSGESITARYWLNLMLAIIPFLPACILLTVVQTTEHNALIRGNRLFFWFIIPIITAILSLTSNFQSAYIYDVQFVRSGAENIGWINRFGFWSAVHLSYSYALVILSSVLLIQQFIRMRYRTYRMRILLLLVGLLLPFIANMANTFLIDVRYFITPIIFNFSTPALFWALFRYRLFELLPIARDQAFEHMGDAIIIIDRENRVVDVNPSAASLAHQPTSAMIEKTLFEVFAPFEQAVQPLLENFSSHHAIEIHQGESKHYFDLTVSPITRDSESVGKVIILHDMTDQRTAEIRAHHLEMEHERLRTLSEFIEAASHEFRTPLSIIKNSAFILSRSDDSAKRAEKIALIDDQTNRITGLVEALLNVVRVNAHAELILMPLNINMLLENVKNDLTPQATAKNVHLEVDPAPQAHLINADEILLTKAIYAVLHNAIRYTPEGGGVTLTTSRQDTQIVLTIKDTGIGIDPENLPHIFDVFYRVDKAHNTAGFGTGLTVANRVITLHGGHIEASSRLGLGTQITIRLPGVG